MNLRISVIVLAISISLGSALANTIANTWFPGNTASPGANSGLKVRYVIIDYRSTPAMLQVELADGSTNGGEALYRFDMANSSEVSRANMFLSSLLAAQASGQNVILHMNSSNNIDAIIYADY